MHTFDKVYLEPITSFDHCRICDGTGRIEWFTNYVDFTNGTRDSVTRPCDNCNGVGRKPYHYVARAYLGERSLFITLDTYLAWLESLNGDDDLEYLVHIYENAGHLLPIQY